MTGELNIPQLPDDILGSIFNHVTQYDLVNLSTVDKRFYQQATKRLYKRITIILDINLPNKYKNNQKRFILENGIKYMDTSLIMNYDNLLRLNHSIITNTGLIDKIMYFIFDKCGDDEELLDDDFPNNTITNNYSKVIESISERSQSVLHITYSLEGLKKIKLFLARKNVRQRIHKLIVSNLDEIHEPILPPALANLVLILDEFELSKLESIDLGFDQKFSMFNSLESLVFSTIENYGLEIIKKLKLNSDEKLKLKRLTLFHCHKEIERLRDSEVELNSEFLNPSDNSASFFFADFEANAIHKQLDFPIMESKIDINNLTQLFLKIDCFTDSRNESYGHQRCNCFGKFFEDLSHYLVSNGGLKNLERFELELFPNLEWLRPHQMLEMLLIPLGSFIKSLSSLSHLNIDFSTLGFKMFNTGLAVDLINQLNERLIQAFFLCFFSKLTPSTTNVNNKIEYKEIFLDKLIANLKTLQLSDFLTSFIYYKPDFYESFLHTCKCWGCDRLLKLLKSQFYPLYSEGLKEEADGEEDDEEYDSDFEVEEIDEDQNLQSSYYLLIGFILGKLQVHREIVTPLKMSTPNYKRYPIFKGKPHTLHNQFHISKKCKCKVGPDKDPEGISPMNIDSLVVTYIIHQLRPIVKYLSSIFKGLDTLMIHGIYYEINQGMLKPIFDNDEYPRGFEICPKKFRNHNTKKDPIPDLPFGSYNKIIV